MIVHIFPFEKFTENFIEFIDRNFITEDHLFILYGDYDIDSSYVKKYPNIKIYNKRKLFEYYMILKKSDAIIIHSFFLTKEILLLLNLSRSFCEKTAWVIWGGDLLDLRKKTNKRIKSRITYWFKEMLIKKLKAVIVLVDKDWENFKETFHIDKKHFTAVYGNGRVFDLISTIDIKKKSVKKINILLGNSATATNNHIESMKYLEKFRNEDIMLYIPLSYGDENYRREIIEYSQIHFPNKVVPIVDMMKYEDYLEFLSGMDIAIFNNNRQQALGNIRAAVYFKCKLFLRLESELSQYFESKLIFNSVKDIEEMSFEQFVDFNDQSAELNKNFIISELDSKKAVSQWNKIFTYLKEG
ncbi:TDP-N-acetylfucosamine:lipid II N-acetylfucosaminyltransferase [Enterococcus casseliflavus]|uniref:TDP-N-acetylfucosamine:lipid II N-acetylfucosaminyltransferase n=1 Tax=Enterococcus casseliflavus TaxID=37734 RepID=UPI003D10D712